jgi:anti-sigma factor RsiW
MMHRLPEDQVEAFEEHYFACNNCATILQRVAAYVDAMRAAARQLWSSAVS